MVIKCIIPVVISLLQIKQVKYNTSIIKKRKDNMSDYTGIYKGKTKEKHKEYYEVKGLDLNVNHLYQR